MNNKGAADMEKFEAIESAVEQGVYIMQGKKEIAFLSWANENSDITCERASFIVRACNSHEDLLEALKRMHKHFITEATRGIGEVEEELEGFNMKVIAEAEGRA